MNEPKQNGRHIRDERLKRIAETKNIQVPKGEPQQAVAVEGAAPAQHEPEAETSQVESPQSTTKPEQQPPASSDASASAPNGAVEDVPAATDDAPTLLPFDGIAADPGSYVAPDYSAIHAQRKRRALRTFGISVAVVVGVLLVAYIAGAVVFMGRFLPNTILGDEDVSMKTDEEVVELLDDIAKSYELDVTGNGFSFQTTGPEIGMAVDSQGIVNSMHADLDAWRWPVLIFASSHDESSRLAATYDKKAAKKAIKQAVKKFNKKAKPPVNATIVFDEKSKKFTIKPEEIGTQLDSKAVVKLTTAGIDAMMPSVPIGDAQLLQPKILSTDEKLIESADLATGMISVHVTLNMNGQKVNEIDGDELQQFVSVGDDYKVKLDEGALNNWVRDIANGYDTIGTQRTYTRADGKEITVKGGVYGWEVDTAATEQMILDAVKAGDDVTLDIPCISSAAVFSAPGQRDWGNRYVDVDISEQYVRFYGDDGKIIWEADCITGAPDGKHDTWQGVWSLNNKQSPSTLIGYLDNGEKDYETEVKYWMAFEGNGIGFHDATWQPGFGGSMYAEGYGSHGCVNLSYSDAESLFGIIQIGDVVVVHG